MTRVAIVRRCRPCGGTREGKCEVGEKDCIWARAYDRLKAYGQEESMLDGPVVIKNAALKGTSAWMNTYLGHDHFAAQRRDAAGDQPPPETSQNPDVKP